jgi:hypothetical protein
MIEFPISLYLDLPEGETADLEVAARASIAFAEAIRELAYILDPSVEIHVDLVSGTAGSLSINSLIRAVKSVTHKKKTINHPDGRIEETEELSIIGAALGIVMFFGVETAHYTIDRALDYLTHKDEFSHLSETDKKDIARRVTDALNHNAAKPKVEKVYSEVERDQRIRGVGATTTPGATPDVLVPRSEFVVRAGRGEVIEQGVKRRTAHDRVRVMLISPVLVPGDRRWRLKSAQGEFGAVIKDKEFVEKVLSGRTRVPMVAGIEMDVDLETVEDLQDGVWQPVERSVTHVVRLHPPPAQGTLPLPPAEHSEPD